MRKATAIGWLLVLVSAATGADWNDRVAYLAAQRFGNDFRASGVDFWKQDGRLVTVNWPDAPTLADAEALDDAIVETWKASLIYPAPEDLCPLLDTNGNVVGTALWLVDAETMQGYATTNSASPRRTWAEQRAAFVAARERKQAARDQVSGVRTNAAAANSVVALRAQVAELARIVEELSR
jgi:hypothetical protein